MGTTAMQIGGLESAGGGGAPGPGPWALSAWHGTYGAATVQTLTMIKLSKGSSIYNHCVLTVLNKISGKIFPD